MVYGCVMDNSNYKDNTRQIICKFCDLELNRQYESLRNSDFQTWPEEIKDYAKFRIWPEEIKDYSEWMSEVWDEGFKWGIEGIREVLE